MTLPAICSNPRPSRWNKNYFLRRGGIPRLFILRRAFYQDESRLSTNVYDPVSTDRPKNGNRLFDLAFFVICNSFIIALSRHITSLEILKIRQRQV